MTGKERIDAVLAGRRPDRYPVGEDFWGETLARWINEGHLVVGESPIDHFDLDLDRAGLVNCYTDPAWTPVVEREDEDTRYVRDGNGALLRQHKHHTSTPEHVAYRVTSREDWLEQVKPNLLDFDERRIDFDAYRAAERSSRARGRHFSNDAFGPFEIIHRLIGHEVFLLSMALDPEWVADMVTTYCEFNIIHWEELFSREGVPDGTWIADDFGYKQKPFMSPAMFDELLKPGLRRMCDFLHARGCSVFLHSCGYIEPLLESILDTGVDCLEGMEYKAGMDIERLASTFGTRVCWFGNMDVRVFESNDADRVRAEVDRVLSVAARERVGYIAHSDHSISPLVDYRTFADYLARVREHPTG